MKGTGKILNALLIAALAGTALTACTGEEEVTASIGVANGSDKILQNYQYEENEELFMGKLRDSFFVTAFRNEYESRQLIITPEGQVSDYNVTVGDFRSGSEVLSAKNFDIRHEYYHEVASIYDSSSTMETGMYPDALLPLQTAREYGLTKIGSGNHQGVYVTVYVPEDQAPGVYTGTFTVTLNGNVTCTVSASVAVLDYTLPDTVSMPSCIPTQISYIIDGEYDDTQEMYEKYLDTLNDFRLSGMYLSSYLPGGTITAETAAAYDASLAAEAARDEGVSAYAIRTFEAYSAAQGGNVLNEEYFQTYLRTYVDESIASGVNLFEKAYVYMGSIIDEPDVGGFYSRANYVCRQFDAQVEAAVSYARSKGASEEVCNALANLRHVVTGAYSSNLTDVDTYCPTIDVINSSAEVEDYRALRESGKDYWWYTCTQPKIPYPTVHIDDNGVSSRVMSWMAKEYDVGGYLTWESAYYRSYDGSVSKKITAQECYDNVHRWTDAYGDGFFFYPGSIYGISGPVPSLRLYTVRDGLEDYEALLDLENIYARLGEEYGAALSSDGVLNQLYSGLYRGTRVYCTSDEVEAAKEILGNLLVLAEQGIAVSDFSVAADGTVSAEIYGGAGAAVSLNGTALTLEGNRCSVSDQYGSFEVKSGNTVAAIPCGEVTVLDDFTDSVGKFTAYDVDQNPVDNAEISASEQEGKKTVSVVMSPSVRTLTYQLPSKGVTRDTGTVYIGVYLSGTSERVEMSVYLQGEQNRLYSLDTVYLHPGYNLIEIGRIADADWSRLYNANYIRFGFSGNTAFTLDFACISKSE